MAETAIEIEENEPQESDALHLTDILKPGINLATILDDNQLNKIGTDVVRDVEIDQKSRKDWLDIYKRSLDVAMQVKEAKNSPWPKASNVKYPLLTTAAIQFQARAYPAIVDGTNLVKGRVLGPDPDGKKRDRADRIGQHMTYQLLFRMPGWEEDTDRLTLILPIVGCAFRKTFYDSIAGQNCSETVSAEDFIINYWAKSLDTAPRYTHVLHYYPYEVDSLIASGQWVEVPVDAEGEKADDEQALVDFYEQHRTLDLDEDGYPEHYVVTTTREGKVARIVPCFGPEDVRVENAQTKEIVGLSKLLDDARPDQIGKVIKITRRQYFTKYPFIPAPDGSFYDIGFGSLLNDITATIDTTINQMIDAGSLQNAQGGFVGDGVNIKGGDLKFRLGEWKRMNVTGGTLRENIVPLNLPGPSAVLFQLLGMMIDGAKEITSVQDVMTGQGTANQPATTTLALIEQGQKVMTGIFKRIHRAFGQELRILRRLNRDFLDDEEYFQLNDPEPELGPDGQPVMGEDGNPMMQDAVKIGREDYADADLDVVPVSDPTMANDMMKMAKSEAEWGSFNGDPLVNQVELRRRRMEAIGVKDIRAMLEVPQPAPDPKVLIEGLKTQIQKMLAEANVRSSDAQSANALADAAMKLQQLGLLPDAAAVAGHATELGGGDDADSQERHIPEMAGESADEGVPPIPEGSPDGLRDGMGAGPAIDGAGAGEGAVLGGIGADQL